MPKQKPSTKLLRWYRKHGRDLPWRHTKDPYRILVSEIMLQQTQVARVIDFYDAWLKRFPDWKSLAKATNAQVIKQWSGLGYNRRALALRDIARQVVENGVPQSEKEWLSLKGIGPYTAAALTVFSLRKRTFPVDTNTRRVIGRLFLRKHFPDLSEDQRIRDIGLQEMMSSQKFDDVIQALFDLANTHCTKTPTCETCPLRDVCKSSKDFMSGTVTTPKAMIKKSNERIHAGKKHPDRIYRGRLLKAVSEQPGRTLRYYATRIDKTYNATNDKAWLKALLNRLVKDAMLEVRDNKLYLTSL